MRDLIDRHDAFGRAMMADLTGRTVPGEAPAETVDGDFGSGRFTYAGVCEGRQRPPDAIRDRMAAGLRSYVVMDEATCDALMLAASMAVAAVWDQAVALAAEDERVPLAGTEAWAEGDEVYYPKLMAAFPWLREAYWQEIIAEFGLDSIAEDAGLPRPRLVLASANRENQA